MKLLDEFDAAVVFSELPKGKVNNGYSTKGSSRVYKTYLDNKSWQAVKDEMSDEHLAQYGAGSGGELEEKDGKPPKMAAFASSSRMIYNLSKDIPNFRFEEKLSTTVGGTANMDGYLERENEHVFVEAKCREPYGHQAEQVIKQAYKPIYCWLREKMPRIFSCVMEDCEDNNMRVVFFRKGKVVAYFDIKQMICHMLGIATRLLKKPDDKGVLFLYLLYNPENLYLGDKTIDVVQSIWKDTCEAANSYRLDEMFGHIVDFLIQEKGIKANEKTVAHLKGTFQFKLCDQNTYSSFF